MFNKMSFFEVMGIADMEKIHSQMIFWIFSNDFNGLKNVQKLNILNDIWGYSNNSYDTDEIIQVSTEYNKIDILIETKFRIFIIENKLKSSQHSNQLEKYSDFMKNNNPYNKELKFYFLTFIHEKANVLNWHNISYKKLLEIFEANSIFEENIDGFIFQEYINSIKKFCQVFEAFDKNHKSFVNVFTDSHKSKQDKFLEYSDTYQDFIRKTNLETILQKRFWISVLDQLKIPFIYKIEETHGTALVQIVIINNILYKKQLCNIGVQFQANTIKINFSAENYKKSDKSLIDNKIQETFRILSKATEYKKVNHPTKKGYMSISKKLNKQLHEYEMTELVKIYNEEFEKAKNIIDRLHINLTEDDSMQVIESF